MANGKLFKVYCTQHSEVVEGETQDDFQCVCSF